MSARFARSALRVACLAAATLAGCCDSGMCCGDVEFPPFLLNSGTYSGHVTSNVDSVFAQAGGSDFRMELALASGTVKVTYERGGQVVEEFWRVVRRDTTRCWECER